MTATLTPSFVVTDDEMQVLALRLEIGAMPVVLALRPRHDSEATLTAAADHASHALVERGLIADGEVLPELAAVLRALERPDRELAMRLVTPDGAARVAVVRRGELCLSARRIGNEIALHVFGDAGRATLAAGIRVLICHLPPAAAAEIAAVGAPLDAFGQALLDSHDAALLSDRIRSLGAEARTAMVLGSALASRKAFAEIVYYTLDLDTDRISRCPVAVGVFYTKRGRIVAAPSASPSGQLWTTLKAGSEHAIKQAVGQLVELSAERWEEL